ncbi:MAG: helix-turn-helix transcriptional regulator [Burkholderiaceae bacterium]|nr:helix-turn-helix transcriptional regulator [Burkholderiaceae bacterium]
MTSFQERLKFERKRLGLSQEKFAALGGVTRDAQMNYENGSRRPDSGYLQGLSDAGVDIVFLFSGALSTEALADDEKELLVGYRKLDIRAKARVLGVIEGASAIDSSPPKPAKAAPTVTFHGSVGQQITGDITAPQTINVGRKKK